jgi:hypothetical protein
LSTHDQNFCWSRAQVTGLTRATPLRSSQILQVGFPEWLSRKQEKVLELPEDCPIAFGYILDKILGAQHGNTSEFGESHGSRQLMWCKVYVLADKLGCHPLAEATYYYETEFAAKDDERRINGQELPLVDAAAVEFLYANTTNSAFMRHMVS